jgi:hypothetical protein
VSGDVIVGWVRPRLVDGDFLDCLLLTLRFDQEVGGGRIGGFQRVVSSANVSDARNQLVNWFLTSTSADWLWMVDTDMVWAPEALHRLLAVADPDTAPIVGGLCFGRETRTGTVFPTLFELEAVPGSDEWRFYRYYDWPEGQLMPVDGTGAAFLLVHRRVFEAVRDHGYSKVFPWFQETENSGGRVSEDLTFCLRARDRGFPIFVHTGVHIGHIKDVAVGADTYRAQQAARQATGGGAAPAGQRGNDPPDSTDA